MHDSGLAGFWREYEVKEMKQDSSTIAWNAMGDEWFELAQTGEARNCFIMPNMLKIMGEVNGKERKPEYRALCQKQQ